MLYLVYKGFDWFAKRCTDVALDTVCEYSAETAVCRGVSGTHVQKSVP